MFLDLKDSPEDAEGHSPAVMVLEKTRVWTETCRMEPCREPTMLCVRALLRGPARRRGADDGILGGRNSAKTLPLEGIPIQGAGVENPPKPMKTEPFCLPRPHRTPLLWAHVGLTLSRHKAS